MGKNLCASLQVDAKKVERKLESATVETAEQVMLFYYLYSFIFVTFYVGIFRTRMITKSTARNQKLNIPRTKTKLN